MVFIDELSQRVTSIHRDAESTLTHARLASKRCGAPAVVFSFAVLPLFKVWWANEHGLGVFVFAVASYTGRRGIVKGRYLNYCIPS